MKTFKQLITEANIDDTWKVYGDKINKRMYADDDSVRWVHRDEDDSVDMHNKERLKKLDQFSITPDQLNLKPQHNYDLHASRVRRSFQLLPNETKPGILKALKVPEHYEAVHKQHFHNLVAEPMNDADGRNPLKEYMPWVAREYAKGHIQRAEDISSTVTDAVEKFHKIKNKPSVAKQYGINRDINHYHVDNSLDLVPHDENEAAKVNAHHDRNLHAALSKVPDHELEPEVKLGDHEVSKFEDDHWHVYVPHTQAAACKYGAGTRWCTAARNGNMFNDYHKDGALHIFVPKNPNYPGEKYQYHPQSGQLMDEKDNYARSTAMIGADNEKPGPARPSDYMNALSKSKNYPTAKDLHHHDHYIQTMALGHLHNKIPDEDIQKLAQSPHEAVRARVAYQDSRAHHLAALDSNPVIKDALRFHENRIEQWGRTRGGESEKAKAVSVHSDFLRQIGEKNPRIGGIYHAHTQLNNGYDRSILEKAALPRLLDDNHHFTDDTDHLQKHVFMKSLATYSQSQHTLHKLVEYASNMKTSGGVVDDDNAEHKLMILNNARRNVNIAHESKVHIANHPVLQALGYGKDADKK